MTISTISKNSNTLPSEKKPTFLKNLSCYFTEYCNNATIHGLKFLGERERSIFEKIWWLMFISLSLTLCMHLIVNTYTKWMNSPVIVSFATSETPIWKIPFPAVTICPLVKIDVDKFDIKKISATNYTKEEATKLLYTSLICPNVLDAFPPIKGTNFLDDNAIPFLIDATPDFDASILFCKWRNDKCSYKTKQFFTPLLTSGTVCYSFNLLDRSDMYTEIADIGYYQNLSIEHQASSKWTVEDGYPSTEGIATYPRRTLQIGTNGGIEIILKTPIQDIDFNFCGTSLKGFKVMLHQPEEIPRYQQHYFWLPLNQLVSVAVKPSMITTSPELKSYKPEDRKCYFNRERKLKFFKLYSQPNCLLECLTNYTLKICDCVALQMPRDRRTQICGPAKFECLSEAKSDFFSREAIVQLKNFEKHRRSRKQPIGKNNMNDCKCFPSCYSLHYDAETSQLDWQWQNLKFLNDSFGNNTAELSRLRVFFKDRQFMASERNELYGYTDFWANCGGLIGLFTGFSFISLIEILYFLSLRLGCNIKRFGRNYWSGAEELREKSSD